MLKDVTDGQNWILCLKSALKEREVFKEVVMNALETCFRKDTLQANDNRRYINMMKIEGGLKYLVIWI